MKLGYRRGVGVAGLGIRLARRLYSHASQQGGLAVLLYDQETTAQKDLERASIEAQGEPWSQLNRCLWE